MQKKKILIIVDWFAPGYKAGGPIRSSLNLAFALRDDYEIQVLTTDTDHGESEPYKGIATNTWTNAIDKNIHVYYSRKASLSSRQLKDEIIKANADYVYLNHVWSPYFVLYPLWLKYTRRIKGKVILCPRGGLYDSALVVKPYKKQPLLKLMQWLNIQRHITFHATNDREKEAVKKYFNNSKVVVADNLPASVQTPLMHCKKDVGALKCVFIARIVAIKNLLFLLQVLSKVTANVELSIIGPVEEVNYWDDCKKAIDALPGNIQVNYLGAKTNDEILPILQQHHLFVLPTTGENFGHSIFEAFLAGRPVLISDQTPWRHLAQKQIGWDLPLNDQTAFANALQTAASWNQQQFDNHASAAWTFAKDYIAHSDVKEKYLELFS